MLSLILSAALITTPQKLSVEPAYTSIDYIPKNYTTLS